LRRRSTPIQEGKQTAATVQEGVMPRTKMSAKYKNSKKYCVYCYNNARVQRDAENEAAINSGQLFMLMV
jgi:hypothetical protein